MSDLEGEKPKKILKFCNSKKIGFLAIEYSGHGKSSGKFTKGNISKWTNEVRIAIKRIVKRLVFLPWNILVTENLQENLQKEILVNGQMK